MTKPPEVFATKRRDRRAALKFLKRTMKRYSRPKAIMADRLRSYRAAMMLIGNASSQECGRWLNNRAENSHQPFRQREGAMARFRNIKTLQKFAAVHASIYSHFNQDRHLNHRDTFKQNRSAAHRYCDTMTTGFFVDNCVPYDVVDRLRRTSSRLRSSLGAPLDPEAAYPTSSTDKKHCSRARRRNHSRSEPHR